MKTRDQWFTEWLESDGKIGEFIEAIQRDAWEAGAKAEQDAIVNDVWGSWAQAGCEGAPIVPFPRPVNQTESEKHPSL